MSEGVSVDPLAENVEGVVVERHEWNHEVQHSVRWDYVLGAVAVLALVWYLLSAESSESDERDETATPTPLSG